MNHLPTQSEIAYAEEIWQAALKGECLSSYSDDELNSALFLVVKHSTHLQSATNDTDALVKVNREIKNEQKRRDSKQDLISKVKWAFIGAIIGALASQVFSWLLL